MKKYAKIENKETGLCQVGIGTNSAFYESIGMTEIDVEQAYDGKWYLEGYAPTQPLDEIKTIKITELKNERTIREEAPINFNGKLWDFDAKSRNRITAAITALEVSEMEEITWTAYDDTSFIMKVDDLKGIIASAAVRGDLLHKQYRVLRDAVNAATSKEEIDAINWQ